MKNKALTYILILLVLTISVSCVDAQRFTNIAEEEGLTFSFETVEYGGGVSFVDFNNDGYDDLSFATHQGEKLKFFMSDGNHLQPMPAFVDDTSEVRQVLWVDYNKDGLLDLYLSSEDKNKLYRNLGDFIFEEVTEAIGLDFKRQSSYCSTWLDYDKDGNLDLCVSHRTKEKTGNIDLYSNKGDGTFEKITAKSGLHGFGESVLAMSTIDYNRDGWEDLYLAQDFEKGNIILVNNKNGTFRDVSDSCGVDFKLNSMTATITDFNADGWEDIYVTNTTAGNVFLENNRDNTFTEVSALYNLDIKNVTFGTIFFDADNDMDLDVHIGGMLSNFTYEHTDENYFVKRNIDWGLQQDNAFNNGVAMGDYNGDGAVDFVKNSVTRVGFINSYNSLWRNDFTGNNFLKIHLAGTISNAHAIGARVELYSEGKTQYRKIGCGESFSSQHSYTRHFGVGEYDVIDSVIVRWPSDNISVLKNISTNQTLYIDEPLGGCMDKNACNYTSDAIFDNGSCRFVTDYYDCDGCVRDEDGDGICDELEIRGCMDPLSCSYNPQATDEDGSCTYLPEIEISGSRKVSALMEFAYSVSGQEGSDYEWRCTNGSIVLGQGGANVMVIWHEQDEGVLEVVEISEGGCTGSVASMDVDISSFLKDEEVSIALLPNPVQYVLYINGLHPESTYTYRVLDGSGRYLHIGKLESGRSEIQVKDLSAGLYVLELENDNQMTRHRFCKL
ncbi:FG-GAP-like repeat-containing protein [Portibacter lacus]|uniref:T9SS C-terminal target domain-containing protein n=1 Tax=Portibacter lacus TaxID=1099794 RepID=A0AA37WFF6_9BACT|nr:FG-GAP-like repeat-containing protein [Portibacter lacus]GLR17594.1 hypothetical protein GCM10007940_22090 [Portibacter lacus]